VKALSASSAIPQTYGDGMTIDHGTESADAR